MSLLENALDRAPTDFTLVFNIALVKQVYADILPKQPRESLTVEALQAFPEDRQRQRGRRDIVRSWSWSFP